MLVTFISEFEIAQNLLQVVPSFGPLWSVKYLNFWPKATYLDSSSYFSGNLNYVLSTRRIQIPIFLDSSSWTPISPTPRKKSAFETWVSAHQVRRICLCREYTSSNKIILLVLTIFHYMIIASQGLKCLWVFLKSAAI